MTEYHMLREVAIRTINHLGIIGECNIQYALNPANGDYRVIEVNARLSAPAPWPPRLPAIRWHLSPPSYMLGYKLHELKNAVTGTTSAFLRTSTRLSSRQNATLGPGQAQNAATTTSAPK